MSKMIDTITMLIGLGIAGYFAYKVVLPKMNLKAPSFAAPPSSSPPPPPPIVSSGPVEDIIEDLPSTTSSSKKTSSTTSPSTTTSSSSGAGPSKATAGAGANTPEKLGYKGTGQKVEMTAGAAHENGQRYNVNHKFKNYLIIGHYKIGSGQQTINCKTDGPNHGSCTQLPKCVWIEPNLTISSGKLDMTSEWPHPKGHNGMPCPTCKTIGAIPTGTFLGWAQALYQDGEFRHIDVWTDKSGNGSAWTKIASETDKGQITNATLAKRPLFLEGKGLEAEVRMHGATKGDTAKKDAWVYEIVPPVVSAAGFVQSFFSLLEAPIPRRYNNR